jgi:hypothetical protein
VFLCSLDPGLRSRGAVGVATTERNRLRRPAADASEEMHMMMNGCGPGMMLIGGLGMLLGLTLLASLMVLVWVVIGRLRREPTVPPSGRS